MPSVKDLLLAVLAESKEKNHGATVYTHGASTAFVATALDDQ